MSEIILDSSAASEKNEHEIAGRETEGLSQRQIILRRFVKHKAAMVSLFAVVFIIIFVFSATGIRLGFGDASVSIPGWWKFSILDIDPEGAVAASCNGGVTGLSLIHI